MMRKMISVILLTACFLLMQGTGAAVAVSRKPPPPPPRPRQAVSRSDKKIAGMMEMLKLIDMLEHMDMMKDYDVIRGDAQHDKSD